MYRQYLYLLITMSKLEMLTPGETVLGMHIIVVQILEVSGEMLQLGRLVLGQLDIELTKLHLLAQLLNGMLMQINTFGDMGMLLLLNQ